MNDTPSPNTHTSANTDQVKNDHIFSIYLQNDAYNPWRPGESSGESTKGESLVEKGVIWTLGERG